MDTFRSRKGHVFYLYDMSNFVCRRLAEILDKDKIKYEFEQPAAFRVSRLENTDKQLVLDAYERLAGREAGKIKEIPLYPFPLVFDGRVLIAHDELSFNRYRALVLRSKFYKNYEGFKQDTYLRLCRQFEQNCLKGGVRAGVWTSDLAELHFGTAAEAGDFFGSGSPGWKLAAFREFLLELSAVRDGLQPVHFSVYDQLMTNGRLVALGDLLKSPGSEQYTAVVKYVRRRLSLPAPSAEEPV